MKSKTSKILWGVLAVFFCLLLVALLAGTSLAFHYENTINGTLGIKTTIIVNKEIPDEDLEYWKSEFVKKDANGNPEYVIENNYRHQVYDKAALWEEINKVNLQVAVEGATFLWNHVDGQLLDANADVSFFGQRSYDWAYVTGGSASTDTKGSPSLRTVFSEAGFGVNRTLWNYYEKCSYRGERSTKINEAPWSEVSRVGSFSSYGDAAIITLGRAGEENNDLRISGSDGLDGSYLDISQQEKDLITEIIKLKKSNTFKRVVLLLNSDHAFSMKNIMPFKQDVDACLWVGSAGRNSAQAVCDILSGKSNPSGSLPDTYLNDNRNSPVIANMGDFTYGNVDKYPDIVRRVNWGNRETSYIVYAEGIYSGYRYYETRYEDKVLNRGNAGNFDYESEVAFPFGYSESYTDFTLSDFRADLSGDNYKVSVKVKNTGRFAGKKSVQIYLQKPYTDYDKANGIEKAAVELVGFGKTAELAPNADARVEILVPTESMKCFDVKNKGTYILEAGDYYLAAGHDAHDALNNILTAKGKSTSDGMTANGDSKLTKLIKVSEDDYEKYSETEDGFAIKEQLAMADINRYANRGDNSVTYLTRKDWTGTYPSATARLSLNDGMAGDLTICKTPTEDVGAEDYNFTYDQDTEYKLVMYRDEGYDSELWDELINQMSLEEQVLLNVYGSLSTRAVDSVGLPQTANFDGPMGLRKYAQEGTNNQLCFASAVLQGATMNVELIERLGQMFGEEMLHADYQVVYAPACNIHRSAFSARNSEYYSEDGVLNGLMAAACVRGGQSKGGLLTVKHFALNDQDYNRYAVGVWCNEQAVREVYIKPFELAVTEGGALAMMTSYNRTGVLWSGGNYNLLTNIARGEWGFEGAMFSDAWSSSNVGAMNYIDGLMAGNDIEFTSGDMSSLAMYLDSNTVRMRLRESAKHVFYAMSRSNTMNGLHSDSEIVHIIPWWKYVLVTVDILCGLLMAACATLLVLSILKSVKEKRNRNGTVGEISEQDLT